MVVNVDLLSDTAKSELVGNHNDIRVVVLGQIKVSCGKENMPDLPYSEL